MAADISATEEGYAKGIPFDLHKEQEERLQNILNVALYKFSEVLRGVLHVELPKIIRLNSPSTNTRAYEQHDNNVEKEGIDALSEIVVDILQETFKSLSEI